MQFTYQQLGARGYSKPEIIIELDQSEIIIELD
jgi:hypothetical protein